MFLLVYIQIKAGISINFHTKLTKGMEALNLNIGSHHHSFNAASQMVSTISDTMHISLFESLIENKKPFSLLLDSSSDITGKHFLLVYIESLESNDPCRGESGLRFSKPGPPKPDSKTLFKSPTRPSPIQSPTQKPGPAQVHIF